MYKFRLTVKDVKGLEAYDDAEITVKEGKESCFRRRLRVDMNQDGCKIAICVLKFGALWSAPLASRLSVRIVRFVIKTAYSQDAYMEPIAKFNNTDFLHFLTKLIFTRQNVKKFHVHMCKK